MDVFVRTPSVMQPALFTVFDLYFSGIVSLQYHPANPPGERMSLRECADVAIEMLEVRAGACEALVIRGAIAKED